MCNADIFLGVLAILFPPLPVWVKCGICSADSLINICLTVLGFLPGLLHAWYVIAKYPEPPYEYEALPRSEGGRVAYVYVQCPPGQQPKPHQHAPMNYGTNGGPQNNSAAPKHAQAQAQAQPQQQGGASNGEGSSDNTHGVPPSYAEVVAGDNKVQTRD